MTDEPTEPGGETPAEPTLAELNKAIREDRQRSQREHGAACRCWLCRGN